MPFDPPQERTPTADPLWARLSPEERRALEGLLGGGSPMITAEIAHRLRILGLAERLLGGFALTRTGRDLMLSQLGWRAP